MSIFPPNTVHYLTKLNHNLFMFAAIFIYCVSETSAKRQSRSLIVTVLYCSKNICN